MKRVVVVSTLYPNAHKPRFGGFVARSMEALARDTDWDVTVINPIGVPPLALGRYAALRDAAVDSVDKGVRVLRPTYPLLPRIGARINPWAIRRTVLPLIEKLHRDTPFALLDAQFLYPDAPAVAAMAAALDLPFSAKARGSDVHYWGKSGYSRRAIQTALAQADGILSVSRALANDMRDTGLTQAAITVHYTGLDRDQFRPLDNGAMRSLIAEEFGLAMPDHAPLLVGVGNLVPVKGFDLAIRALALLEDAHLAIIGTGDERAALERLARATGVAERVHFLGGIAHATLPVLYSAADAMVLPSRHEGLANDWIEALACGTPIVVSDVGGVREVVQSAAAGRIVARDPQSIAAGIREVLVQPRKRREVAGTVARFDWRAHAEALARHYDSIVERRS